MKKYKNANGTGSITKVKINRTNPFRVRVTNPVTKKRHSLGYFLSKINSKIVKIQIGRV